jgi:hypothetical protein
VRTRRTTSVAALVAVVLVTLVGCGDDGSREAGPPSDTAVDGTEAECAAAVASIVSATERYVRSYEEGRAVSAGTATVEDPSTSTTAPDSDSETLTEAGFQATLADAQTVLTEQGCDPTRTRGELTSGLSRVSAEDPVADAVLRQLTASLTGEAATQPTVTAVAVGDDLRDALARSPDGSTLQLEAGEYRLDGPLVLLAGIDIRGAGRDATTILSTAPEAAVLALTERRVELTGLTVHHVGDAAGSVVLGGPAASIVVSKARVTGGKADSDGQGGAGILMYAGEDGAAGRGTTLEVTDAELRDNEAAGILLTGGHRSSIVGAVFASNGQCGICFLGPSDGSVEDSAFDGNGVGVAVAGTAAPSLLRISINGGEVGLQASDSAAPAVEGATISGSSRAAVIYRGPVGGSLSGVSCVNVPFGIVVDAEARPHIGDVDCELSRSS